MGRTFATILMGTALVGLCTATAPKRVLVTMADAGKTIQLSKGDRLVVQLDMSAGTGYTWKPTSIPTKLLTQSGAPTNSGASLPGGKETLTFRFVATAPGTDFLTFGKSRSWQKSDPTAKTFSITVQVNS